MDDKKFASLSPEYKQILTEIGVQLAYRKGILFERTLLKVWPVVVLLLLGYADEYFKDFINQNSLHTHFTILFVFCAIFVVFYTTIFGSIIEIEKRIWVDSYFDGKKLNGGQSWKIARRLFWPAFWMYFRIFVRYYLPLVLILIGFLALYIIGGVSLVDKLHYLFSPLQMAWIQLILLILPFLLLIGIFLYSYFYLRVRLRYVWFIFLDTYQKANFSYSVVFEELNKLNSVSKSDSYKKALILNLGTDSVNLVAQVAVGGISYGISQLGKAGEVVGSVVNVVGKEASHQATSFANIAAMYILYRFALEQMYGEDQEVNENIYKLAE